MTEHLKGDGGESGTQPVLAEAHTPSSIISQLSTNMEEKEEVRAITGFKVCKIYPSWPSQNWYWKHQWILVVTAILSSHMLFALDNTIVANIQPVSSLSHVYGQAVLTFPGLSGHCSAIQWSWSDFMALCRVGLLSYSGWRIEYISQINSLCRFTLCSSATVLPWSKVYATYNAKWLYIGVSRWGPIIPCEMEHIWSLFSASSCLWQVPLCVEVHQIWMLWLLAEQWLERE